ncbi:MAG: L,D-transpeptidase [Nocardioidaceae bacterium]|nr:L,D-transpeptidase [Nocardioidaceae bacterium]
MSNEGAPRRRDAASLSRLAAVAGAAVVTVLAVAGASGLAPGTAMGETPAHLRLSEQSLPLATDPSAAAARPAATQPDTEERLVDKDAGSTGPGSGGPDSGGSEAEGREGAGPDPAESTAVPVRSGHGKRVVYDIGAQRVWLVSERGTQTRTYLVSGSKDAGLLDPGRYRVYSKSRHAVAYNYEETMNYMVRFAYGERWPIGFHDVPAFEDGTLAQSRSDLGTPQSAGCIRAWITDAKALWQFSDVGTPVVVVA